MRKLYYVNVGLAEPTYIYELVPRLVGTLFDSTVQDISDELTKLDAKVTLIDNIYPQVADQLKLKGKHIITGRVGSII